jgi:hypothetical protein
MILTTWLPAVVISDGDDGLTDAVVPRQMPQPLIHVRGRGRSHGRGRGPGAKGKPSWDRGRPRAGQIRWMTGFC